ncbi:ferredoxin:protochlorophyllide reductase (ATP-dependent) subunit B, partial [Prochlorococcus sp. AH-716-M18]|nr:ferredoxin:protochlorophyllide reductase (ATP-dependent) subunit B [Prochlorococcus sp. AH-716-M18]
HQSHLGHTATNTKNNLNSDEKKEEIIWTESGRAELTKVPFFVRGKVKTNTEKYAILRGIPEISDETLYDAKAYFS